MRAIANIEAIYEHARLEGAVAELSTNPDRADVLFRLGVGLELQRREDEAIKCYQKAVASDAKYYPARISLLQHMQRRCEWHDLKSDIQKLRKVVRETPITNQNHLSPFVFLSLPGTTDAEQKRCAERYTLIEYPPHLVSSIRNQMGFDFKRVPNNKIHLGYLSEDFSDHATSKLMAEIFELHDRSYFHITAYSYSQNDGSAMRKRLEKTFDSFVDILNDSHEEAAKKIYKDHTDILIDLKGYTPNTRSAILALRPAPIQVNYLGYPGTMGADFVDYIIADHFIIPPEKERHYKEKVICLPDCYQPNDRSRQRLPTPPRSECGLPEQGFIFCCFNQSYKITPDIFAVWCQLLKAVPESSLWLLVSNPHAEINLRWEAENHGVNPARLIMAPTIMDTEKHLARLQCADLFLDTLPYNAHTTCSDALWMGLPVVTCAGETFTSRVAGSLLTAIGTPELITYNLDDYYRLALELATNGEMLATIRNKIITNRDTAPLFDSERFTRNLERAYLKMMGDSGLMPTNM